MNQAMIETKSDAEMQAFGERLGRLVKGGEVLELVGDVGAGKTTLVRGMARGMGVEETVQSPSFTISRVYDAGDKSLVHYDFYRLNDPGIMADELADTLQNENTVVVIEWAAAVSRVIPEDHLTITIESPSETSRRLTVASGGLSSQELAEGLL